MTAARRLDHQPARARACDGSEQQALVARAHREQRHLPAQDAQIGSHQRRSLLDRCGFGHVALGGGSVATPHLQIGARGQAPRAIVVMPMADVPPLSA